MLRRGEYSSAKQRRFLGARASGQPVRNPPELRKVHAGLESAYLAAVARKDKTSRELAKRIKGPWVAVEKLLARGRVPRGNPPGDVEAERLIKRYGWREALAVAESIAHQRGVPRPSYTYWRNVIDAIKARAPAGVYTRRNKPKRARKRSRKANPSSSRRVAYSVRKAGRVVGKVVASSRAAAAREAKAAGYTLGRHVRANPPRGAVLSERAESITYQHDADGEWYKHTWKPGVAIKVSPDRKTVSLYRPDGKPVAGNFWVPNRAR